MEQTAVSGINETQVETILETLRFHLPSQVNHRNVNKMSRRVRSCTSRWGVVCATAVFLLIGPTQAEPSTGPTLDEPIHMPTMTDTSTLDVVIVEGWHVDTIDGTTRQKLINIHVDDWWEGVEIRVPVRLVVPLEGTVEGFVISGSGLNETPGDDEAMTPSDRVALDAGAGVVTTKIRSLNNSYYPDLPSPGIVQARFAQTLDWRYSEYFLWSAIMMRAITAAFDDEFFQPGPVIAYGNSKNGMTPLISSIHDDRITAVRSTHAFTTYTPIRAHEPTAVAEVEAANEAFAAAFQADDLPEGDQPWSYYDKGFQNFIEAAETSGWSSNEALAAIDRFADDLYVSENWDELTARGVEIFTLPGSHDWVAYDVPGVGVELPGLRTYIVPNGGHARNGHSEAPSKDVDAAFFAEQLAGADRGLETPEVSTVVMGDTLVVTVTFADGGVPEESKIFWMYDRGPDGSSWYLYDLIPEENWAIMNGSGNTWTASIPLDSGHASIDLITTHTVTVNGRIIPISAPYTRVTLARAVPFLSSPAIWLLASVLAVWGTSLSRLINRPQRSADALAETSGRAKQGT
ncbi:MAG: hypothetical protein CMN75_02505 [Spirochaeta sp.]|nr:hypothetical protein [Spirochaeta sp.]RPG10994.1 MAG: hypothetical protein CBC32_005710 [Proteobacteria bacterium TMED72]